MSARDLRRFCPVSFDVEEVLRTAFTRLSLSARTTGQALGWTLGILIALTVGLPMFAGILGRLGGLDENFMYFMFTCPSVAIGIAAYLDQIGVHETKILYAVFGSIAAYALMAVFLMMSTAHEFDRISGRQPS